MHVQSKDLYLHIVQEVGECLENGLYTDLILRCGGGATLHAHKLVLSAVSPYVKWLLESTEWEELQTLELPDASQENLQLLLDVIYNGEVEATIEDLREMILLAHRLYISIPLSDELMAGLDLTLPKLPPFTPPAVAKTDVNSLLSTLQNPLKPNGGGRLPPVPLLKSSPGFNPLVKNRPPPPLLAKRPPMAAQPTAATGAGSTVGASLAAASLATGGGAFRRKLEPSVMTAIMANSKNSEHVCPLCNLKFNNGTAFKHHMKSHDDNEELREQRNAVLGEMIATCFNPQTSLYTCHVCNSNYNHSGNFKQHLLKHERESGSISATLVAQVGGNPHLTNVLQSAMTDRVDKCDQESEEKKYQYKCEHCDRAFKHPGNYKQHLLVHTKANGAGVLTGSLSGALAGSGGIKRPYGPSLTSTNVGGVDPLEAPAPKRSNFGASSNEGTDSVGCPACSLEFSSMEALQSHISISHKHLSLGSAAATASATSNGGGSTSSQMPPLMIQSQSKPQYRCDICQQTFRTESFLSQHKMSFHKISSTPGVVEPGFGCTECGQMFQSQGQLTKHMRLHGPLAEQYKYPCNICGKKFTRPHHVTRHMLLHTGENPFKCTVCTAAFPRVESLRTHEAKGCGLLKASGGKLPPPSGLVQGSPGQPVFDMTDGEAMGDDENGEIGAVELDEDDEDCDEAEEITIEPGLIGDVDDIAEEEDEEQGIMEQSLQTGGHDVGAIADSDNESLEEMNGGGGVQNMCEVNYNVTEDDDEDDED